MCVLLCVCVCGLLSIGSLLHHRLLETAAIPAHHCASPHYSLSMRTLTHTASRSPSPSLPFLADNLFKCKPNETHMIGRNEIAAYRAAQVICEPPHPSSSPSGGFLPRLHPAALQLLQGRPRPPPHPLRINMAWKTTWSPTYLYVFQNVTSCKTPFAVAAVSPRFQVS